MSKKIETRGRPRKSPETIKRIAMAVNVNENEYPIIKDVASNLGYSSISAFLRSAITKGILMSIKGELTEEKDIKYWKYLLKNWDSVAHFSEISKK
jgi:AraC-like DNA-binding protein